MSPLELATLIKESRARLGLTQVQLAEQVGLSEFTISRLERHPEHMKMQTVLKVFSALGLKVVADE